MSSYRSSYVPWTSSYKSGSGSAYSSRDDISISSDTKPPSASTPRFGSITSPAAYRPSYSGGTYRSVPIKREPPKSSSYSSRYTTAPASTRTASATTSSNASLSASTSTRDDNKSSSSESSKKSSSKYSDSVGIKDVSNKKSSSKQSATKGSTADKKLSRLSTSTSNLSKYGKASHDPSPAPSSLSSSKFTKKSRDPSPVTTSLTSGTSKYTRKSSRDPSPITTSFTSAPNKYTRKSSRDPSPVTSTLTTAPKYERKSRDPSPLASTIASKYGRQSRDTSPVASSTATSAKNSLAKYRASSRDPSPVDRKTNSVLARGRSRDPSPLLTTFRGRSRDPSPAESLKERISSATSGYSSSYRLFPKTSSTYSLKYDCNISLPRANMADRAVSYMSSSDVRARSVLTQREQVKKYSTSALKHTRDSADAKNEELRSELETAQETTESEESSDDTEGFITLTVVTRGTSPTPPNATTVVRNRRTDLAKTIEKTVQKSIKKRKQIDKEIQSDRLDDPTRYSRFSATGRVSALQFSSYLDSKLNGSSRYSPSKLTRDASSKTEGDITEKKKKSDVEKLRKDELSSSKESISLSRSNSSRSISKIGKSSSDSKSKSLKPQGGTKQKSPDSTPSSVSRALPPTVPKTETSAKSGNSTSISTVKWPNKDFRKSVLNIGPTDRPRKSRTPSTSTDTDEKYEKSTTSHITKHLSPSTIPGERSPSVASESSNSATSSSLSEDEQKKCPTRKSKVSSPATIHNAAFTYVDDNISMPNEKPCNSYNKTSVTSGSASSRMSSDAKNSYPINARQTPTVSPTPAMQQTTNDRVESSSPVASKIDEAKSYLIRKFGSVSNFFARNVGSSGETLHLDQASTSLSNEPTEDATSAAVSVTATISLPKPNYKTDISATANLVSVSKALVSTNSNSNSYSKSEQESEDSTWWQNTSQQIDTVSALDLRDEMKYKLRHIDSGELSWWNRNENDDETIAEDIKTFQDDQEGSENTDQSPCFNNSSNSKRSNASNDKHWSITINDDKDAVSVDTVTYPSPSTYKSSQKAIDHTHSGELPWWITENCMEGVRDLTLNENVTASNGHVNSNSPSIHNLRAKDYLDSEKSLSLYKLQQNQSVDKRQWLGDKSTSNSPAIDATQRSTPSREKISWMNDNVSEQKSASLRYSSPSASKKQYKIRHIQSGEKAWWMQDDSSEKQSQQEYSKACQMEYDQENALHHEEIKRVMKRNGNDHNLSAKQSSMTFKDVAALGHRASPEGLEDTTAGRKSPNDNIATATTPGSRQHFHQDQQQKLFISRYHNIDELLGVSFCPLSPIMDRFSGKNIFLEEITPAQVRIHDSTPQVAVIQRIERDPWDFEFNAHLQLQKNQQQQKLDDAAIQVYKDGDYGAYLDLESSLAEQAEEIEGINSSRKNSLVVRTQLSVRVHAIIEKLLSSEGSELRRALFSLKQIFQEDKDLVHGFVALGGLNCLVRVGNGADQNYQNYILRALGQVMLYVDGMNGVMKHGPTIQWLYSLIASKYRLVVKTALKLLLVFVEYTESNCYLLVNAIHAVDNGQGTVPWSNIMKLMKDYENADTELLIYATSLINKTLSGLSDQDSFYDESDHLEQQGMEGVIQRYMSRPGTDLDLLDQLQLYEAVLKFEDGETDGIRIPDSSIRKTLRYRSSNDSTERRKSRRHSTGTSPVNQNMSPQKRYTPPVGQVLDEDSSSSNNSNEFSGGVFRECKGQREGAGVTPGLRRRRERAERQKTFMKEQQEAAANGFPGPFEKRDVLNGLDSDGESKRSLLQLRKDQTVKDITQKLTNLPISPQEEKHQSFIGEMTGLISKAKEGLAKSKSKGDISRSPSIEQEVKKAEPKKSENELHWEELVRNMSRPLNLCDMDFTDLNSDDEKDVLAPRSLEGPVPPPPPPLGMPPPLGLGPPPPFFGISPSSVFPPPPTNLVPPSFALGQANKLNGDVNNTTIKKNKKTVKLFWKEVREDMIPPTIGKTIWDELPDANVDTQKLEHLFESRAKDLITKEKQQELNKNKEIIVLDHKRSNAINIAITKLPPPRAIKAAILKMDATVVTREGIDKLLNMLPTDEERGKIQEAQMSNPELPLGSAEQFLLTLSSISELAARLKLWAFKLDFENCEKEIAEPLMDLKQGLELLKANKTFKCILSTLLSIGIFLNGAPVKGFQIEYLAKVPEVKDTVHKHSLLHHLCHMVMESSPDTTDLYSEIGAITRASKADFTELAHSLVQLETECKSSWDRLKLIAKHDCPVQLKQKLVDFLADCAERIIILQIVHRRVINRYRKFLLWLGVPQHRIPESKPNEFCRIVSEFALEYRTTRERVQQQIEKKANHRERNKTRGKMIIDVAKFRSQEDRADAELKQLLGTPNTGPENVDGTLTWRRRRAENLRSPIIKQNEENFTDGDDEILESLVKTATKASGPRPTPRERKRTRHADRKSLKRSRTREGFAFERVAGFPEN